MYRGSTNSESAGFSGIIVSQKYLTRFQGTRATHPPGGVLFLWHVCGLFGYNLISASLITILFTALTVIPIYRLAGMLYGQKVARYALLLFLITPNFVMFTGTSMDGPFSVFPILSVYLFYVARDRETIPDQKWSEFRPYSLLTGLSLALGMFMTYSTVVVGVFFMRYCLAGATSVRAISEGTAVRELRIHRILPPALRPDWIPSD